MAIVIFWKSSFFLQCPCSVEKLFWHLCSVRDLFYFASGFRIILKNAHCQSAFDVIILAHHLEWNYRVQLGACLGNLLCASTALWTIAFISVLYEDLRFFLLFVPSMLLRSPVNRKRLVYGWQVTVFSTFASHYC